MTRQLSKLTSQFNASPTANLIAKIATLREAGQKIISLNIGEPDFPTPPNIKEAAIKAINDDFTKYTATAGILPLRESIADKLLHDNNLHYDVSEIAVTVGAKQAIACALMAVVGEGDEVIIPSPCFVSYPDMVKLAYATPVTVPLKGDNYDLDIEAIDQAVNEHTKAIIICTPNNPTGTVFSEASLRELARLVLKHDLYIITDEIYEKLIYDSHPHFSIASISDEVKDHTITINGFSKTYAMTGWRLGYVAANKNVIKAIVAILSQTTSAPASMVQMAAIEALKGPQDAVDEMVKQYDQRRRYCLKRLRAMNHVTCADSQGAFYLFPDMSAYMGTSYGDYIIKDDYDLCHYLLESEHIACVPGSVYHGPNHIRLSYSCSLDELKEAMDGIENALTRLK